MTTRDANRVHDSWKQVGDRLESLGLKLKLHVEEERSEDAAIDEETLAAVLAKFGKAVEDVFDGLGDAFGDDAVRDDAREAGRLLMEAVDTTFGEVGEQLRRHVRN